MDAQKYFIKTNQSKSTFTQVFTMKYSPVSCCYVVQADAIEFVHAAYEGEMKSS